MAGDWIKWVKGLARRREVVVIASRLNRDRHEVAGRLMTLWEWCDDNIAVSDVPDLSLDVSLILGDKPFEFIDALLGLPGMAEALSSPDVRWLEARSGGRIVFPNLARHNGTSAKTRAYETSKKQKQRSGKKSSPKNVPEMSPKNGDKTGTREEKRRDIDLEKKNAGEDPDSQAGGHTVPFAFCINLGVTDIDLGGKSLEYHEDPAVWESEFIRRWNRLPRVNQRTQGGLDFTLQKALQQRLLDPTWRWQQAFAMFPIEMDLDFIPNLTWFLKPDTVSKILDKSFRKTRKTGKQKTAVDFAANLRAFAEGGSNEQSVFESGRVHDNGWANDGSVPEGNASLAD